MRGSGEQLWQRIRKGRRRLMDEIACRLNTTIADYVCSWWGVRTANVIVTSSHRGIYLAVCVDGVSSVVVTANYDTAADERIFRESVEEAVSVWICDNRLGLAGEDNGQDIEGCDGA